MLVTLIALAFIGSASAQDDCSVFMEGSCPLDENNIVGLNSMVDNPGACQTLCKYMYPNHECQFFTHFGEECYQLANCTYVEPCPGCVSGPIEPNFDSCPWPPVNETTTMEPGTTTTMVEETTTAAPATTTAAPATTTAAPATTTQAPTTTAAPTTTTTETEPPTTMPTEPTRPDCVVNEGSLCSQAGNLIEHIEHIHDASDCQAICQNHANCEYWSHYLEEKGAEHWGHCWLHRNCDSFEPRDECKGAGDRECNNVVPPFGEPRPGGMKCYCQNGGNSPDLDDCGEEPPTASPCEGDFYPGVYCDEEEMLEIEGIPSASECQAICQNHPGCEYFSQWFEEGPEGEGRGWCYLFRQCRWFDESECREAPDQCFSGPAYPDMDDCSGP